MRKDESTANNIGMGAMMVVGFLAFLPIMIAWRGYVLSILWGWFVSPLFGLPVIGVAQAIGLSMVVAYMTQKYNKSDEDAGVARIIGFALLAPAFALLVGWLIQRWAM